MSMGTTAGISMERPVDMKTDEEEVLVEPSLLERVCNSLTGSECGQNGGSLII